MNETNMRLSKIEQDGLIEVENRNQITARESSVNQKDHDYIAQHNLKKRDAALSQKDQDQLGEVDKPTDRTTKEQMRQELKTLMELEDLTAQQAAKVYQAHFSGDRDKAAQLLESFNTPVTDDAEVGRQQAESDLTPQAETIQIGNVLQNLRGNPEFVALDISVTNQIETAFIQAGQTDSINRQVVLQVLTNNGVDGAAAQGIVDAVFSGGEESETRTSMLTPPADREDDDEAGEAENSEATTRSNVDDLVRQWREKDNFSDEQVAQLVVLLRSRGSEEEIRNRIKEMIDSFRSEREENQEDGEDRGDQEERENDGDDESQSWWARTRAKIKNRFSKESRAKKKENTEKTKHYRAVLVEHKLVFALNDETEPQKLLDKIDSGETAFEDLKIQDQTALLASGVVRGEQFSEYFDFLMDIDENDIPDDLNQMEIGDGTRKDAVQLLIDYLEIRTDGPRSAELSMKPEDKKTLKAVLKGVYQQASTGTISIAKGVGGLITSGAKNIVKNAQQRIQSGQLKRKIRKTEKKLDNAETDDERIRLQNERSDLKKERKALGKEILASKAAKLQTEADKLKAEIAGYLGATEKAMVEDPESHETQLDELEKRFEENDPLQGKMTTREVAVLILVGRAGDSKKAARLFNNEDSTGYSLYELAEFKKKQRLADLANDGDYGDYRHAARFHFLESIVPGVRIGLNKNGEPDAREAGWLAWDASDRKAAIARIVGFGAAAYGTALVPGYKLAKGGAVLVYKGAKFTAGKLEQAGIGREEESSDLAKGYAAIIDSLTAASIKMEGNVYSRLTKELWTGAKAGGTTVFAGELGLSAVEGLAATVFDIDFGEIAKRAIEGGKDLKDEVVEQTQKSVGFVDPDELRSAASDSEIGEVKIPESGGLKEALEQPSRLNDGQMPDTEPMAAEAAEKNAGSSVEADSYFSNTAEASSVDQAPQSTGEVVSNSLNLPEEDLADINDSTVTTNRVGLDGLNGSSTEPSATGSNWSREPVSKVDSLPEEDVVELNDSGVDSSYDSVDTPEVEDAAVEVTVEAREGTTDFIPKSGDTANSYFYKAYDRIPALEGNVHHPGGVTNALKHLQEQAGGTDWIAGESTKVLSDTVIENVVTAMEDAYWEVHQFEDLADSLDPDKVQISQKAIDSALNANKITEGQAFLLKIGPGIKGTDIADFTDTNEFKKLAQELMEKADQGPLHTQ